MTNKVSVCDLTGDLSEPGWLLDQELHELFLPYFLENPEEEDELIPEAKPYIVRETVKGLYDEVSCVPLLIMMEEAEVSEDNFHEYFLLVGFELLGEDALDQDLHGGGVDVAYLGEVLVSCVLE